MSGRDKCQHLFSNFFKMVLLDDEYAVLCYNGEPKGDVCAKGGTFPEGTE